VSTQNAENQTLTRERRGDKPSAPVDCSAIDRSVCHNAECHAPKRNCCAAHLGCEGFETLARVRPNAGVSIPGGKPGYAPCSCWA
jgi:hypothetical protein